jgi:hypothetical protein
MTGPGSGCPSCDSANRSARHQPWEPEPTARGPGRRGPLHSSFALPGGEHCSSTRFSQGGGEAAFVRADVANAAEVLVATPWSASFACTARSTTGVGFAPAPAYTAAKHGELGLPKVTALDYAAQGIRINTVCSSFIERR